MDKILSVSIASYNVEKFLGKALDSCLIPEIMDQIEIIVVNDGSQDGTAALAQSYVNRWPDTFCLINKQNGGYGSTVNAGIRAATGKYFRLLDGDDWFDGDELVKFIDELKSAEEDMVVARFKRVFESDGHIEERNEASDIPYKSCEFDQIETKSWFTMHAVTYRTDILKHDDIVLTEHCFYTDQEYDLLPLKYVKTVRFLPYSVYCYRIGREEQSVSPEGVERHYKEQTKVLKRLYSVYNEAINKPKNLKDQYIKNYLVKRTTLQVWNYLLIKKSAEHKTELKELFSYLKHEQPIIYKSVFRRSKRLHVLVLSNYLLYGYLHDYRIKKYRY